MLCVVIVLRFGIALRFIGSVATYGLNPHVAALLMMGLG